MAVVDVQERPIRNAQWGQGYARRRKRVFRVLVNSELDGADTAGGACGISIGDAFQSWDGSETDPLCTCTDADAEQTEDGSLVWIVTFNYQTPAVSPQQSQSQPQNGGDSNDPTQWLPKITRTYGQIQLVQRKCFDRDGNNTLTLPLVNSAGYPFRNVPPRTVQFSVYTHERYQTDFSSGDHRDYANSLNNDDWNGFAPGMWWLMSWEVEDVYIGGTKYYRHKRQFGLCPDDLNPGVEGNPSTPLDNPTWQQFLLLAGTRDKDGNAIKDPQTGLEVSQDWPLDSDGYPLSTASITAGNFWYRQFPDHKELPFTVFDIDDLTD